MRSSKAKIASALGIAAAIAGGGLALGSTASAAPAAGTAQVAPSQWGGQNCWYVDRWENTWHGPGWNHQQNRWNQGWWGMENRGHWVCR